MPTPIKVKITDIVDAYKAISELPAVPYKLAWRLSRVSKKIEPEVLRYQKDLNALLTKYGRPAPSGYTIEMENREVYQKSLEDRNQEEVEVEVMPIPLSLFDFAPDPKYPNDKFIVPPVFFHFADWLILDDSEPVQDQFKPEA